MSQILTSKRVPCQNGGGEEDHASSARAEFRGRDDDNHRRSNRKSRQMRGKTRQQRSDG